MVSSNKYNKLSTNSKGAIDMMFVLLLVVLLAVGGLVAWRVTSVDKEVADTSVAAESGSNSVIGGDSEKDVKKGKESSSDKAVSIPNGWTEYSMKKTDMSFKYPTNWSIKSTLDSSERTFEEITLTAPDKSEIRLKVFKFLGGFSGDEPSAVIDDVIEATNETTNKTFSALTYKSWVNDKYIGTSIGTSEKNEYSTGDSRQLIPRLISVDLNDGTRVQLSIAVSGEGDEDFAESESFSSLNDYKQIDAYKNTEMFMENLRIGQ